MRLGRDTVVRIYDRPFPPGRADALAAATDAPRAQNMINRRCADSRAVETGTPAAVRSGRDRERWPIGTTWRGAAGQCDVGGYAHVVATHAYAGAHYARRRPRARHTARRDAQEEQKFSLIFPGLSDLLVCRFAGDSRANPLPSPPAHSRTAPCAKNVL